MTVVSVSLPDALVAQLDAFRDARGYSGRSELVRAALRDFLARERQDDATGRKAATLTLLYPEGHEREVSDVRHEFSDIVRSMMHGHARGHCIEVFVLEGPARRIRAFADTLRAARETRLVQVVYAETAGEDVDAHDHAASPR